MNARTTRRKFLKAALAGAAVTLLPTGRARAYAANEAVNVAVIGVWNIGQLDRRWLVQDGANIVALCDVDRRFLSAAAEEHPQAKTWADFRRMLQEQKDVEAVMVCTPDHTHAAASMMAMKLGKHVCTEKPLAHSVYEARALGEAAARCKVATQLDNEGHSSPGMARLVEWVQSGAIGKVRQVHAWANQGPPQGPPRGAPPPWPGAAPMRPVASWDAPAGGPAEAAASAGASPAAAAGSAQAGLPGEAPARPALAEPPAAPFRRWPPPYLEWDLWVGPAPYRDYHEGLHPAAWRMHWDFGTGRLGDMGCHLFDGAFWSLKLGHPTTVEAASEGNTHDRAPQWAVVTYQFPARGDLPPVTLTWYNGGKWPPRPPELREDRSLPPEGSLFIGDEGKILVHGSANPQILPAEKMREFQPPEPFIRRSTGHKKEWLEAIRGGPPPGSNFAAYGGPLTEVVLLGNVAIRTGKKIEWDPVNLRAKNVPEAAAYIRREYRKGWEL
ncbi:MAG: Gfo/Idh/MocA family oxidoreductase [Planctomycetes bacterium]|nr:Gfo/Idh/MocA family oxidoreductase [Planctomycetota bacterium]